MTVYDWLLIFVGCTLGLFGVFVWFWRQMREY